MNPNLEEELNMPPSVQTIENASVKNPLFQEALRNIKNPRDREAFLGIFRKYIVDAYKNNPRMNRLMKTHSLADKIAYSPETEEYDGRSTIDEHLYSEPGRNYHYTNNILGTNRDKKSLLRRTYEAIKDFTFETLPGVVGLGGYYAAQNWHAGKIKEGLAKRAAGYFEKPWYSYLNPFNVAKDSTELAANEGLIGLVGSVLSPAKYLLGGYFLYKTMRYFMKRHSDKKKFEELNKRIQMQNQLLAQRI